MGGAAPTRAKIAMLDRLRDNSRSIGTYIILGAIIIVFIAYFGPGASGCMGASARAISRSCTRLGISETMIGSSRRR